MGTASLIVIIVFAVICVVLLCLFIVVNFGSKKEFSNKKKEDKPVQEGTIEPIESLAEDKQKEALEYVEEDSDDIEEDDDEEDEDELDDDESSKNKLSIRSIPFEIKLKKASKQVKQYYKELKAEFESYGMTCRRSKKGEKYNYKGTLLAQIKILRKNISIYVALPPRTFNNTKYVGVDVSDKKLTAQTPFRYDVKTDRKLQWAKEIIGQLAQKNNLIKK